MTFCVTPIDAATIKIEHPKGWKPGSDGKTIKLKVHLDSLSAEQKRVFKLAMDQWVNWKTRDPALSNTNYQGADPPRSSKDVMSGEPLQDGTTGRNLSGDDIAAMNTVYDSKTISVTYTENIGDANFKAFLDPNTTGGFGYWAGDGAGITSGGVKIQQTLPESKSWYFVKDTDGDGKITNADRNADGIPIVFNQIDYYSLVKHEIGHTLGLGHAVPEPSSLLLLAAGCFGLVKRRRYVGKADAGTLC